MNRKKLIKKYIADGKLSEGLQIIEGVRFHVGISPSGYSVRVSDDSSIIASMYYVKSLKGSLSPRFIGYSYWI